MGKEKKKEKAFKKAIKPLIKYLAKNHHPHTKCLVENNRAELLEGLKSYANDKFITD